MDVLNTIWHFLNQTLFQLGGVNISLMVIVVVVVLTVLLMFFSRHFSRWIVRRVLSRFVTESGSRETLGTLLHYCILIIGMMIILQTAGVQLSSLVVVLGTVGIGLGLGLQPVVNSFISGLLILFEKPFKVGDEIRVGNATGEVMRIRMRTTTLLTKDNITFIIANADFTTMPVTNWSDNGRQVRVNIRVVADYSADPQKVRGLLLQAAGEHAGVLKQPAPEVVLRGINEGCYRFLLQVWTVEYATEPIPLASDLNFRILELFTQNGIGLPKATMMRTSPEGESSFIE